MEGRGQADIRRTVRERIASDIPCGNERHGGDVVIQAPGPSPGLVADPALSLPGGRPGPAAHPRRRRLRREHHVVRAAELPTRGHLTGDRVDLVLAALEALELQAELLHAGRERAAADPGAVDAQDLVALPVPPVGVADRDGDGAGEEAGQLDDLGEHPAGLEGPQLGVDARVGELGHGVAVDVVDEVEGGAEGGAGGHAGGAALVRGQPEGVLGRGEGAEPGFGVDALAGAEEGGVGAGRGGVLRARVRCVGGVGARGVVVGGEGEFEDAVAEFRGDGAEEGALGLGVGGVEGEVGESDRAVVVRGVGDAFVVAVILVVVTLRT